MRCEYLPAITVEAPRRRAFKICTKAGIPRFKSSSAVSLIFCWIGFNRSGTSAPVSGFFTLKNFSAQSEKSVSSLGSGIVLPGINPVATLDFLVESKRFFQVDLVFSKQTHVPPVRSSNAQGIAGAFQFSRDIKHRIVRVHQFEPCHNKPHQQVPTFTSWSKIVSIISLWIRSSISST